MRSHLSSFGGTPAPCGDTLKNMARARLPRLRLKFHGRIIDHLGIQMYESPIAAIAELVANAWDADAERVDVTVPYGVEATDEFVVADNGGGMTLAECEDRYLNVGYAQRGDDPQKKTADKHRPLLGRKGIGKFAGFGIAQTVVVDTTSKRTGEKTVFRMDLAKLRTGKYVAKGGEVKVLEYLRPDARRRAQHGTTIRLSDLKLARRQHVDIFRVGLARRFLLHESVADFKVFVNSNELPVEAPANVQYQFPRDYRTGEAPAALSRVEDGGWGVESLPGGVTIRWRVNFFEETIKEEDLRGIAVFAHGKLAQVPFFFGLSGGLSGQHGQQYISGQVEADYLDELVDDVITTERQRIVWTNPHAALLQEWGQARLKELLSIWRDRRAEENVQILAEKVEQFDPRLSRLKEHERRPVETALRKIAGIETLSRRQFVELGDAVLTSWERGRLRDLITDISERSNFSSDDFIALLAEAQVLAALNIAEVVKTKHEAILGLQRIVDERELENDIRDYIAERPWLLDQAWETFRRETRLDHIFEKAAAAAELTKGAARKRVDLALRSGEHLLVVEFMRPGEIADWDHLNRIERYITNIRNLVAAETALGIRRVSGLVVADSLEDSAEVRSKIEKLRNDDVQAFSWPSLLAEARRRLQDFLVLLMERAPDDPRLRDLAHGG
ncbi:MAG TPA: ATP-binding protein [Thermoanaerobaculia bacterium]|nr:ATP-binding protein [Thermoanaerobaculia bacterium]